MLLDAVDKDLSITVNRTGCGQDQRSHPSRPSWNCSSTSLHVAALRGPGGKASRNSSTDVGSEQFEGRAMRKTSTSCPSSSPGTVISTRLPGCTRAVVWCANRSFSDTFAMINALRLDLSELSHNTQLVVHTRNFINAARNHPDDPSRQVR